LQDGQSIQQERRHEAHRNDGDPRSFHQQAQQERLPFFKLLKKADKFVWDDEAKKAFEALEESLTTPPIMAPANPKGNSPTLHLCHH
jgi:hypothetical protein